MPGLRADTAVVADAQAIDDTGSEGLDDHVSRRGQREKGRLSVVVLQVELDPAHAAMTAVREERRFDGGRIRAGDRAHFDDASAVVGQQPRAARRGADRREIEDGDTDKRPQGGGGRGVGHSEVLGEAELAPGDDVLLYLRSAAADGVDDGVAVGRLGSSRHRCLGCLDA